MTGEKGELSCKGERGRGKVSGWNEVSTGCRRHFSDVNLLEAALPGAGNGRGGTVVSKSLSDGDQRRTTLCRRCAKLIDQQYSCFGFEMDRTGCVKPGTWPGSHLKMLVESRRGLSVGHSRCRRHGSILATSGHGELAITHVLTHLTCDFLPQSRRRPLLIKHYSPLPRSERPVVKVGKAALD